MNLSDYVEKKPHRMRRIVWAVINASVYRLMGGRIGWPIRKLLLKSFGAKIDRKAYIYARCVIFAPWNLVVERACIGPRTEIYNKAPIRIGNDSVISQGSFLCAASHDISSKMLPLKTASITIENNVWIASDAFIGMGVTIGEGAVVGARAAVFKNVEPWTVVGGNPAKFIKKRIIKDA